MRRSIPTKRTGDRDEFGVSRLQREIDKMFDDFIGFGSDRQSTAVEFYPRVDVRENDSAYILNFDLPGISKDDVRVEIQDNRLLVSGERHSENREEDKQARWVSVERSYGTFARSFELPSAVNRDNISADYEDGVLRIEIPKSEEARPRQIKVGKSDKGVLRRIGDAVTGRENTTNETGEETKGQR